MTQEVLTALGASAPAGEGDRNPVGDGLPDVPPTPAEVRQTGDHKDRPSGGDEGTDCHASVATLARNDRKQAEGLSSRTSPQTGVAIRSPQEDEETDCHASVATLARNDRKQAEGLSSRTSPQTGVAIRSPQEDEEERIATPVTRSPARNDRGDGEADAFLREHFARLCAQGEALRREDPSFDLDAALHDPAFLRLTAPGMGVDVRRAWTALHPETLERRAAADSAGMLARSLSTLAARPREGGGQGGGSLDTDYRRLSRAEQLRLKQRIYNAAALGEKIYP